jgi:hypothetical protein
MDDFWFGSYFVGLLIFLPIFIYIMINEWFINKWYRSVDDSAIEEAMIETDLEN